MCYADKTNVVTDVFRIVNKFDIYQCDLGEVNRSKDNTLGKVRPCVIVSSDDINCIFSNQFVVVPLRTVHKDVTDDNIQEFINDERSLGRISVPVKMNDTICVLDTNQIRQVPTSKVYKYIGTIVNKDVRKAINAALMELLFSHNEFVENNNENIRKRNIKLQNNLQDVKVDKIEEILNVPEQEEPVESEPVKEVEPIDKKKGGGRKLKFSTGFSLYYRAWAEGKMKPEEIAEKCKLHITTIYSHIRKYHELHPEVEVKVKTRLF